MEALKTLDIIEAVESTEELQTTALDLFEIDITKLPSPVLARLIDEVRNDEASVADAYSRYHNRHNRSR